MATAEAVQEDVVVKPTGEPELKKYTQEQLLQVFDELMFNGEYQEEVTIKNKLKVTFRSRTVGETMEISQAIDSTPFNLVITVQEKRAFMNLTKSLIAYQGKPLADMKQEEKEKFINKLPVQIIATLSNALSEFDRKIDLACREGDTNF